MMLKDLCSEENDYKIPACEGLEENSQTTTPVVPGCGLMTAGFQHEISLGRCLEVEGMFISKPNQLSFFEKSFIFWLFVFILDVGAVYRHPEMLRNELGVSVVVMKSYREVKVVWY